MEYKKWLVECDRKEGSVASKYTEILDKETDLSISYIYKMAHTGAKNQSYYSAYLRFLLWGKEVRGQKAIPEYISDGHKKRLQTFAARFSESSSSQTSAQSDDSSFGPIISFRDFLKRLTNIDDDIFLDELLLDDVENTLQNCQRAVSKTMRILELERELSILEALQESQ